MSKLMNALLIAAAATALSSPAMAASGSGNEGNDTMACDITVEHMRGNVISLTYTRDFVVSPSAPYSDDFSTATRFRFFDATVERIDGSPVVTFVFDADVDVFNSVNFGSALKIRDENKGDSLGGTSSFFGSGTTGSHRSFYSLTCKRA